MTLAVNIAQGASNNVTFRNRIINGGMVIDQRNAGASITPTTNVTYALDRWCMTLSQSSKFSVQQQTSVIPTGFNFAMKITSLSAYTVGAGEVFGFRQMIEGFNFADMGWGTANAKTITLSFWVYSSLTGTFGGAFMNSAENRSYPFTYTISSANTWTQISITVAGDTSGTWIGATNGVGLELHFSLGVGSTLSGTAGAWAGATYFSATGATSVVGTNGATFYITGVQLEAGTTASPFEYRQYGTELALCQRYYEKSFAQGTVPADGVDNSFQTNSAAYANSGMYLPAVCFKATKRTTATVTLYRPNVGGTSGNWCIYSATLAAWVASTSTVNNATDTTFSINFSTNLTQNNAYAILGGWTASAEL